MIKVWEEGYKVDGGQKQEIAFIIYASESVSGPS